MPNIEQQSSDGEIFEMDVEIAMASVAIMTLLEVLESHPRRSSSSACRKALEILHNISQSLATGPRRKNPIDPFCASLSGTLQLLPLLKREKAKLELQKTLVQFLQENGLE